MAIALQQGVLDGVGLPSDELERFAQSEPGFAAGQSADALGPEALAASRFFVAGQGLLQRLPPRPRRS
jgi:hypothetical protein